MSHDEPEHAEGSEPDPFDAIGREIASLLRATHDSSSRIQAEAEQRAAERLAEADREATARVTEAEAAVAEANARVAEAEQRVAEADRRAAEQLAEAERHEADSNRRREEAEAVLRQAEATRNQTRAEAATLLRGVLALLDAADARSSQLVNDIEGSRTDLANVRTGLAQFSETLGATAEPLAPAPSAEDVGAAAAGIATAAEETPTVIDLRDEPAVEPAAPTEAPSQPGTEPGAASGSTAAPAETSGPAPWSATPTDAETMDDRVAASVRSAVSRAIDQCLTTADELPPPPTN